MRVMKPIAYKSKHGLVIMAKQICKIFYLKKTLRVKNYLKKCSSNWQKNQRYFKYGE